MKKLAKYSNTKKEVREVVFNGNGFYQCQADGRRGNE